MMQLERARAASSGDEGTSSGNFEKSSGSTTAAEANGESFQLSDTGDSVFGLKHPLMPSGFEIAASPKLIAALCQETNLDDLGRKPPKK